MAWAVSEDEADVLGILFRSEDELITSDLEHSIKHWHLIDGVLT